MYHAAEQSSPGGDVEPEPLTVLVVDDERAVVEGLTELLEDEGYRVAAAMDGLDALDQLLRGLRPSLIVLDLMMPRMDGWDFRHEQMKVDDLKDIPLLILSAAGFSKASIRAQFGDVEFLPKPSSAEALLRAVRQTCGDA